jgi:glycine/D-amino acid oxidase-like deaminating enzyme
MVALMSRSIDLLEEIARESDNRIQMNRRGYLYATAEPAQIPRLRQAAEEAALLGSGPLRVHDGRADAPIYQPAPAQGFEDQPDGADLILDPALIRTHFPYLSERTIALLHARRCGWFSAQQLGMYLLEQARAHGVRLLRGQVTGIDATGGRVRSVQVAHAGTTTTIATPRFVNAAGPFQKEIGRMLGVELPIFAERHIKIAFNEHFGVVPRHAPLLIWIDGVALPWSADEREALADDETTRQLLEVFPAGVHCRPEGHGGTSLLILWTYDLEPVATTFPITFDEQYPELALRGMSVMIPGLARYFERFPKPYVDGGYYVKTRENRPLVGPLPVEGAYMLGALSGFGLMASCASGELLAAHITGAALPHYAPAFLLSRYDNPAYRTLLENWSDTGQL